jgi:hypothetical protein
MRRPVRGGGASGGGGVRVGEAREPKIAAPPELDMSTWLIPSEEKARAPPPSSLSTITAAMLYFNSISTAPVLQVDENNFLRPSAFTFTPFPPRLTPTRRLSFLRSRCSDCRSITYPMHFSLPFVSILNLPQPTRVFSRKEFFCNCVIIGQ